MSPADSRFPVVSAFLHLAMVLFLGSQEPSHWCCPCPIVVIQGVLVTGAVTGLNTASPKLPLEHSPEGY